MWEGCSQPHHHITDAGIEALHRFLGTLLDGVQFLHQGVLVGHDPKVIVEVSDELVHRFMWGPWVTMSSAMSPLIDWYTMGIISSSVWPLKWKKPMVFFHIS